MGAALHEAAREHGSQARFKRRKGEFLGTTKEDGTDAEQRADARAAYEALLAGGLEGQAATRAR
jgi:hypothetical protein